MANVARVAAFEVGDPMAFFILVEAYDCAIHEGSDAVSSAIHRCMR